MKKILLMAIAALFTLCGVGAVTVNNASAASSSDYATEFPTGATLLLPSIFGDNMVLQQHEKAKIWGLTSARETATVTLKLGDETITHETGTADEKGLFEIFLPQQKASFEEYTLTVSSGDTTINCSKVLFGEVWLSCGQSNMQLALQHISGGEGLISSANKGENGIDNDKIRVYLEPDIPTGLGLYDDYKYRPQFSVENARWGIGNKRADICDMSGVSYAFAVKLYKSLNVGSNHVPIAILNTSLGATSIEAYMSRGVIEGNDDIKDYLTSKGMFINKANWNKFNPPKGIGNYNQMTALFNHKIAPIAGYSMKGIIWYQGENNMGDEAAANFYKQALPKMVNDWSVNYWGYEKTLPTVYIHLAANEYNYFSESLPLFWEALSEARAEEPQTFAQIPIYDIPLNWNEGKFAYKNPIHPLIKIPVGERAAYAAEGLVYGLHKTFQPATYKSMEVVGSGLELTFENVGDSLKPKTSEKTLHGFTICGKDRKFVEADASIIAPNKIRVSNSEVKFPVAATYGWAGMNIASNLVNGIDFPTVPFRTDKTESLYYEPKDWLNAEDKDLWLSDGTTEASGITKVWKAGAVTGRTANMTVSRYTENAAEGNAAIKLDYPLGGGGVGVSNMPKRTGKLYNPMFGQITRFSAIEFKMLNLDNVPKEIYVTVKAKNKSYKLLFKNTSFSTDIALAASAEWQTFRAYLSGMRDESGELLLATSNVLAELEAIEFGVATKAKGSIAIDALRLCQYDAIEFNDRVYRDDMLGNQAFQSYEGGGGIKKVSELSSLAISGSALSLDRGRATATYNVKNVLKFDASFLVKGGTMASAQSGGLKKGVEGAIDISKLTEVLIGSDGFSYVNYESRWYRYRGDGKGDYKYVPITGAGAIFPAVTLPEKLTPCVLFEYTLNGENWLKAESAILSMQAEAEGYYKEKFGANIPEGALKVRVSFNYDELIDDDGNEGRYSDRETMLMMTKADLFTSEPWNDSVKPQIDIKLSKEKVKVGETVAIDFSISDDKSAQEDIDFYVEVTDASGVILKLENGTFIAEKEGTYTIKIVATDKAGNISEKTLTVTAGGSEVQSPQEDNGTMIWLIIIGGIAIVAATAAIVILVVVKKKKQQGK